MRYTIVKATGYFGEAARLLEGAVNKLMAEGWAPAGGVAISQPDNTNEVNVAQAMTHTTDADRLGITGRRIPPRDVSYGFVPIGRIDG